MRETKTTTALRQLAIFNQHNFYLASGRYDNPSFPHVRPVPPQLPGIVGPMPYISYRAPVGGRPSVSAAWLVVQYGVHLNPHAHWLDCSMGPGGMHDTKPQVFPLLRTGLQGAAAKKAALAQALAWAAERWPGHDWSRDPYGGYGPAEFIRQRLAQLLPIAVEEVKNMSEGQETQAVPVQAPAPAAPVAPAAAAAPAAPEAPAAQAAATPRLPRDFPDPAGCEELRATVVRTTAAANAYIAAQQEKDGAAVEANKAAYQEHRRAYRELLDRRRAAWEAAGRPAAAPAAAPAPQAAAPAAPEATPAPAPAEAVPASQ